MTARFNTLFIYLFLICAFCFSAVANAKDAPNATEQEYKLPKFLLSDNLQKRMEKHEYFSRFMLTPPESLIIEDPLWYYAFGLDGYKPLNRPSGYLGLLESALGGNPVSMFALTQIWEWRNIKEQYPQVPENVFDPDFWRAWAARYTSLGWTYAREGDAQKKSWQRDVYAKGALAGSMEGAYLFGEFAFFSYPDTLYLQEKSAYYGWPPAMVYVAERYRTGTWLKSKDVQDGQDFKKRAYYLNKAMDAGYDMAYLEVAMDAYTGEYGQARDIAKAYYYFCCFAMAPGDMKIYPYWEVPQLDDDESKAFFLAMNEEINPRIYPDPRKEEIKKELVEYAKPLLTRAVMVKAREDARAHIEGIKVRKVKELEKARAEREILTKELCKELAPVVGYLNSRKPA